MLNVLKRAGVAAAACAVLTLASVSVSSPAQAQHWRGGGGHWRGGGYGWGPGVGFATGLAIGSAPYYYGGGPYAYGGGCYLRREIMRDRWGHRIIRRVRVCD
jgi:hypothetical protein